MKLEHPGGLTLERLRIMMMMKWRRKEEEEEEKIMVIVMMVMKPLICTNCKQTSDFT